MSQHDMDLANAAGASFRSDANAALLALVSNSSGATAPATTFAYQLWADTTTGWLKQRNAANSAWIFVHPLAGHAEASVASATTTDLGAQVSDLVLISGTTPITGFGTADAGRIIKVRHSGVLTLTHNGTSLILPGAANITTAAGDTYEAESLGSGNWVVRAYQKANGTAVVSSGSGKAQDFRLTLTSATPVTPADVTGATTIYCTPYKGNQIALYDGSSSWNTRTSAEFSLALGTLTSGKPYDVFCYDNAGTPTLEFLAWTNDTTRATALVYQDGVLVKSGATTRRYLGTFYTTSTTQTEDSQANRYLWNYYNRVQRSMKRYESTASWTYTTATFRQANGSASNQLNYVVGVAEDEISARVLATATGSTSAYCSVGIGVDSTTVNSGTACWAGLNGQGANPVADYSGVPGVGRHYLAWLEYSAAVGTTTWASVGPPQMSGLTGRIAA